ncbi:TIGR03084 family protein [Kitasatospora xanthocidica]|uniref:TIGR03084 family protein n=1 Tax=Kitasatospora xanthocidica TaxID=83382 RepID=A0A372ZN17_9ACTN|nr:MULTISPECIES: TIGR03084 family metal-binding protein [Streptomycetaceae]OKI06969.1 wyosine base formation domain-containing protein [Streptomyces sp. CB02056]RGD57269.1 TIGR03084 family protein [Kitasatospora xanthocidica]
MVDRQDVISALVLDGEAVDALVANLPEADWARPTPAPGWTVAHQVAHLTATFRLAGLAAGDPEAFRAVAAGIGQDMDGAVQQALKPYLAKAPKLLLESWQTERRAAEEALAAVPADRPLPWLVRPLTAPVLAAAGMMELFGHGQDIADALGERREHTDRIRYLVEFAVRTWDFGYQARGLTPPETTFRFEITAPSGARWEFGPADAEQRVSGPAVDFCLLVTRRRHRDDLALTARGEDAEAWLDLAQAYRGPAGPGRTPGQFRSTGH